MTWLAIVGTLLGAMIGAASALFAQQIAARDAVKRERSTEIDRRISSYILMKEEAERIAKARDETDAATKDLAHRDLYASQKILEIICSDELRHSMNALTGKLIEVIWRGLPDDKGFYDLIRPLDENFLDAAKREIKRLQDG
jgi:gas vesicle protein